MKNERLVIVALLALVAVLLMRPADAQPGASGLVEPVVVAGAVSQTSVDVRWRFSRFWSDGRIDAAFVQFEATSGPGACAIDSICLGEILPGSCAPDITRNGNVDFEDILPILTEWGSCDD